MVTKSELDAAITTLQAKYEKTIQEMAERWPIDGKRNTPESMSIINTVAKESKERER